MNEQFSQIVASMVPTVLAKTFPDERYELVWLSTF
jgi:hypothetical protein